VINDLLISLKYIIKMQETYYFSLASKTDLDNPSVSSIPSPVFVYKSNKQKDSISSSNKNSFTDKHVLSPEPDYRLIASSLGSPFLENSQLSDASNSLRETGFYDKFQLKHRQINANDSRLPTTLSDSRVGTFIDR